MTIHIYYSDGDEIVTRWNGTEREAVDYYTGMSHNGFAAVTLHFPDTNRWVQLHDKKEAAGGTAIPTSGTEKYCT